MNLRLAEAIEKPQTWGRPAGCFDRCAARGTAPRAPVKYSGGLSHDLRSPRKEMQIVHHRTSSQIKQVLALSAVPGTVALPMPDVRQIVLDSGSFTQRGASFTRALTNPQFLQQLLVSVQLDATPTLAACTTRSLDRKS